MMPNQQDIAFRSYQIWEREGRPHGRDQEHWYRAERELTAEQAKPKAKTQAKAKAKTVADQTAPRSR